MDLQSSSDDDSDFEPEQVEVDEGVSNTKTRTRVACRKVSFSKHHDLLLTRAKKNEGEPSSSKQGGKAPVPKPALKKTSSKLYKDFLLFGSFLQFSYFSISSHY